MAFVNEILSDEDRKKYDIKLPSKGLVDHERDICLVDVGGGGKDIEQINRRKFQLNYKGLPKVFFYARCNATEDQQHRITLTWDIEGIPTISNNKSVSNKEIKDIIIEAFKNYDSHMGKDNYKEIIVQFNTKQLTR